jgi:hypothetical protein
MATETAPARVEATFSGLVLGTVVAWSGGCDALIELPDAESRQPVAARSVVALDDAAVGRQAVVGFEGGDRGRPIILGLLANGGGRPAAASGAAAVRSEPLVVARDGERIVLQADREIVLQCGQASITLTRAGKVVIRGTYVSTRSSGVNRIKGGSVQIN